MKRWYVTLVLLLLGGCVAPTRQSPLCEEFYSLPTLQEEHKRFKAYPIEAKLEIYFCGMQRHPPRRGYASEIASEGDKNVPFLLERLKAEESDIHKYDIIYIFEALATQGHLTGRQDVLHELEEAAQRMKFKRYKERSYKSLQTIRERLR